MFADSFDSREFFSIKPAIEEFDLRSRRFKRVPVEDVVFDVILNRISGTQEM